MANAREALDRATRRVHPTSWSDCWFLTIALAIEFVDSGDPCRCLSVFCAYIEAGPRNDHIRDELDEYWHDGITENEHEHLQIRYLMTCGQLRHHSEEMTDIYFEESYESIWYDADAESVLLGPHLTIDPSAKFADGLDYGDIAYPPETPWYRGERSSRTPIPGEPETLRGLSLVDALLALINAGVLAYDAILGVLARKINAEHNGKFLDLLCDFIDTSGDAAGFEAWLDRKTTSDDSAQE